VFLANDVCRTIHRWRFARPRGASRGLETAAAHVSAVGAGAWRVSGDRLGNTALYRLKRIDEITSSATVALGRFGRRRSLCINRRAGGPPSPQTL